jgi:hypothetical protein
MKEPLEMNYDRRKQIDKLAVKLAGVKTWLEIFYTEAETRLTAQHVETGGATSARDERDCEVLDNAVRSLEDIIDSLTVMTLRGGRRDARLVEQAASANYCEEPRITPSSDSLGGGQ